MAIKKIVITWTLKKKKIKNLERLLPEVAGSVQYLRGQKVYCSDPESMVAVADQNQRVSYSFDDDDNDFYY